jgi:hypothetical protein
MRAELEVQEAVLKSHRDERKSALPIAELRRRAEKDRDAAVAKLARTNLQLDDNQEQQQQLSDKADKLYVQRGMQEEKLEKLKVLVAGYTLGETASSPVVPGVPGPSPEQAKLLQQAKDAIAQADCAKAEAERRSDLASNALRAIQHSMALFETGNLQEAQEMAAGAKLVLAASSSPPVEPTGTDDDDELMQLPENINKKARTD